MNKKSSFFNLLKEELHQKLPGFIAATAAMVFPMLFMLYYRIDNILFCKENGIALGPLEGIGGEILVNGWLDFLVVLLAFIVAMGNFGYLLSKKEVDFYHGLPVSRGALFGVRCISGILLFLIPYLIMLAVGIVFGAKYDEGELLRCAGLSLLARFAGYLILYFIFVIILSFTGKIYSCVFTFFGLNFGISWLVFFVLKNLEKNADTLFFTNLSSISGIGPLGVFTPVGYYVKHLAFSVVELYDADLAAISTPGMYIKAFLYAGVLAGIAALLYRNRKMERTGSAFAYRFMEPFLGILTDLCGGVMFGYWLSLISNPKNELQWMIFGGALGTLLAHVLFRSMLTGDVRKCFSKAGIMAGSFAAVLILLLASGLDWGKIDERLPKINHISELKLEASDEELLLELGDLCYSTPGVYHYEKYIVANASTKPELYRLMEFCLNNNTSYENAYYQDTVRIEFVINNRVGISTERVFSVNRQAFLAEVAKILNSGSFRKEMTERLDSLPYPKQIKFLQNSGEVNLSLTEEQWTMLKNAYRRDLNEITWEGNEAEPSAAPARILAADRSMFLPVFSKFEGVWDILDEFIPEMCSEDRDDMEKYSAEFGYYGALSNQLKSVFAEEPYSQLTETQKRKLELTLEYKRLRLSAETFRQLRPYMHAKEDVGGFYAYESGISGESGNEISFRYSLNADSNLSEVFRIIWPDVREQICK